MISSSVSADKDSNVMPKRSAMLFGVTFLSVLSVIFAVGSIAVFGVLEYVENRYHATVQESTYQQASAMARILESRVKAGVPLPEIAYTFQEFILGSHKAKSYMCLIRHTDARLICHPDSAMINAELERMPMSFADKPDSNATFGTAMAAGKEQYGRLTTTNEAEVEFVYSVPVQGTPWVVNAHQNVSAVETEISSMRTTIIWSAALVGLIMAFPASVVARSISRKYEERIEIQSEEIARERERSEQLLLTIFPASIAEQLKEGQAPPAEQYESVSILFADISGFTELASKLQPTALVDLLNTIFTEFDSVAERVGVEKIKTIGDSYMAVAGLPIAVAYHEHKILSMALGLLQAVAAINKLHGTMLSIRVGVHTGTVVAGVIGKKKFAYDLWGDAVNIASRMEAYGVPNTVHCSEEFLAALHLPIPQAEPLQHSILLAGENSATQLYVCRREPQHIKGKGIMSTFTVECIG